jgi:prepilin-type N-terminal cleavage/methylation domain-containing protein
MNIYYFNKGFSLIELAVSVVIIGLLVGGIANGSKLVAQAELRGFIAQMDQLRSDYTAFKLEYNAVPGDMRDASVFFSGCASGGVGNANCNGNGDGYITLCMGNAWDGDGVGDEQVKFFRHLNMAGINSSAGTQVLTGFDCYNGVGDAPLFPKGRVVGSAFSVGSVDAGNTGGSAVAAGGFVSDGTSPGSPVISNFPYNSTIVYAVKADDSGSVLNGSMPALFAHNIDRKVDDGDSSGATAIGANTGKFRTTNDKTGSNVCVSTNTYNIATLQSTCIPQYLIK